MARHLEAVCGGRREAERGKGAPWRAPGQPSQTCRATHTAEHAASAMQPTKKLWPAFITQLVWDVGATWERRRVAKGGARRWVAVVGGGGGGGVQGRLVAPLQATVNTTQTPAEISRRVCIRPLLLVAKFEMSQHASASFAAQPIAVVIW